MKPIAKIAAIAVVAFFSAIGLGRLAIAAQPQQPKPVERRMAEMNSSQEVNDGQNANSESVQRPMHVLPQQNTDSADQPDSQTAESPNGDGDGETNDDG